MAGGGTGGTVRAPATVSPATPDGPAAFPSAASGRSGPGTLVAPSSGSHPSTAPGVAPPAGAAPSTGKGGSVTSPSGAPGGPAPSGAAAPVSCRTDLPLAQSPDAPYSFLCTQGGVPLSWSTNHLVIYKSGLSLLQGTSLTVAIVDFQLVSHFQVSFTTVPADANVTITTAPLGVGQPGYVEDGYTTVSYRCAPRCSYYSAAVELSSTAQLLQTDWISTLLHELGHVAGLNHVSRQGQVMYPYLTALSPVVYASGDSEGLSVLASERGA